MALHDSFRAQGTCGLDDISQPESWTQARTTDSRLAGSIRDILSPLMPCFESIKEDSWQTGSAVHILMELELGSQVMLSYMLMLVVIGGNGGHGAVSLNLGAFVSASVEKQYMLCLASRTVSGFAPSMIGSDAPSSVCLSMSRVAVLWHSVAKDQRRAPNTNCGLGGRLCQNFSSGGG